MTDLATAPATPASADAPTAAARVAVAMAATVIGNLLQVLPVSWTVYAAAVFGVCAAISATWRQPANPALYRVWVIVNAMGLNVGFARNVTKPPAG